MSNRRGVGGLLVFGLCVSAVGLGQPLPGAAAPAMADSFGEGFQEVHIGAASFQHLNNGSGYEIDWSVDGYMGYTDESFLGVFVAPLLLPVGAEIVAICTHYYDTSSVGKVTTSLDAVKLATAGHPAGVVPVWGPLEEDVAGGYDMVCSDNFSYTFRNATDVDGDGNDESIVHRVRVEMTETDEGRLALGGVRVLWRRQVSPPPSSPSFADVPVNHPFFQWIEALKKSNITAGCSEQNFCPNAPLTRAQMAVFLAKALGLHWPY